MNFALPQRNAGTLSARRILMASGAHLSAFFLLWVVAALTGQLQPLNTYASTFGVLFLTGITLTEFALAIRAASYFSRSEPLYPAWVLIALSSACRLAGILLGQFGDLHGRAIGRILLVGPVPLLLLGLALWQVLKLYREMDFDLRPVLQDYIAVAAVGLYGAGILTTVILWLGGAAADGAPMATLGWTTYPLRGLVLLEAVLLRRAAVRMLGGLISRCWTSYTAAVILTTVGDLGQWLEVFGFLTPLGVALFSILAHATATAYALGPAWQYEALQYAVKSRASTVPGGLEVK